MFFKWKDTSLVIGGYQVSFDEYYSKWNQITLGGKQAQLFKTIRSEFKTAIFSFCSKTLPSVMEKTPALAVKAKNLDG